jgi:hypothetical protein
MNKIVVGRTILRNPRWELLATRFFLRRSVLKRKGASRRKTACGKRPRILSSKARVKSKPPLQAPMPGPKEPSV